MIRSGNRFPLDSSDFITGRLNSSYPVSSRTPKILLSSIPLIICSIFFLVVISPVTALDWTIETVDSAGDVGRYTSLVLDDAGNPRISYQSGTMNTHLKSAQKTGDEWTTETVDATNNVGLFSSLKLDDSGQPLISYYDGNIGNLSFAFKNGTTWSIVIIDSVGVGRYTSLAVDSSGDPRISYQDLGNGVLKYAAKRKGIWTIETVDNSVNVGAYSSLVLDSAGTPHISYYDSTGYLKYAVKISDKWTNLTVDSNINVGYDSSIALNESGNPSISYSDGFGKKLKYATKTGSSWKFEIVDNAGSFRNYTSLAFDSFGIPHISYYDGINGHLKYATKTGNVWTTETVDSSESVGAYSSLALDSAGIPRISYYDRKNGDLKYATGIAPLLQNFTSSSRGGTAPLTVEFSDTSTGGLPSLWNWSFGDGTWFNTSDVTLRNPEHIYETPGTYNVNLTIRNFSVTSTLSRMGYITAVAPPVTPTPSLSPLPTPDPTPTPNPTISPSIPFVAGDGGDEFNSVIPTSLVPGGEGPLVCQTVNVGGESSLRRVLVTGKNNSGIIVTASKLASRPPDVPPINIPVFEYIDVVPARFSYISDVQLEFEIPLELMGDQNISRKEAWLYLFQNGTWIALPTSVTGIKNGRVLYRAGSPEFSLFAITINNTPFSQSQESAFTISPETDIIPAEHEGDPKVPAFADPPVLPNISVTSVPEQPDQPVFSGIMVISIIVISAVLVRLWWIRRQNPP